MRLAAGIFLFLALASPALAADSVDIYQSELNTPLGSVFSNSAERRRLDQQRTAGPVDKASGSVPIGEPAVSPGKSHDPAGFIIGQDGVRSAWVDGDFRQLGIKFSDQSISFPGSITIATHKPPPDDLEDGTQDSDVTEDMRPSGEASESGAGQASED